MRGDAECPYCGAEIEINHDDGYGYEESETHQQECSECCKIFAYTTEISFHYSVLKADCLNGAEHPWKPIVGCPEEYFRGRQRCINCGEERDTMTPEARKEVMDLYFARLAMGRTNVDNYKL